MKIIYKFTHWITYLTITHGVIYGVYKYFFQIETEYGIRPHPIQDIWLALHIMLSPLLVFAFGLLWKNHIVLMYHNSLIKRRSGLSLVVLMILMIFSGYLLQIIYEQEAQKITAYVHIAVSAVFSLGYIVHHLLGKRS